MGLFASIIVGIVGIVLALVINMLPITTLLKIVPLCWLPWFKCDKWYDELKIYIIIVLLTIVVYFIPII